MTLLLAVLASMRVHALLRTVTRAMTLFLTVYTLDSGCHRYVFGLLFLAVLLLISKVSARVRTSYLSDVAEFTTVAAQGNTAILDKTGGGETLEVLLLVLGPARSEPRAARLLRELDGEHKLALGIAN